MNATGQAGVGKKICLCAQLRAAEKSSESGLEQRTLSQANAPSSPSEIPQCPKGHPFTRDGGTRCTGGSHYATVEDESKAKEGGEQYAMCAHGYPFNREDGTRCKGGTHRNGKPEEEKPEEEETSHEENGQANNGEKCCCHCCVHQKCNTRFRRECATVDKQIPCPLRRNLPPLKSPCQRVECEHGYAKNADPKKQCAICPSFSPTKSPTPTSPSGSCKAKMVNQPINGGCVCQCKCSCHRNESKNNVNPHGMHRDLCPYGFRFTREKGKRCHGGVHSRPKKTSDDE